MSVNPSNDIVTYVGSDGRVREALGVAVLSGGGGGGGGGGGAATIANGADVAQGNTADAAYTDRTGAASGTIVSVLKGLFAGVVGNVASGTADSGNPVKVGGVANALPPTALANGQRADRWSTLNGAGVIGAPIFTAADGVLNTNIASVAGAGGANGPRPLQVTSYVYNGATYDRQRGDTSGTYVTQKPTAGQDLSGTATTTSGGFNLAADATRHSGDVQGQNISTVNIGFNEFGGTAAIGTAGTYTVAPGQTFSITTNRQVNFIAASGTAAITITKIV